MVPQVVLDECRRADLEPVDQLRGGPRHQRHDALFRIDREGQRSHFPVAFAEREGVDRLAGRDAGLGFTAVYREGFETVLFYQALGIFAKGLGL